MGSTAVAIMLGSLVGVVVQYWVIRLAVRHAIADAGLGCGRRSTFAKVAVRPGGSDPTGD